MKIKILLPVRSFLAFSPLLLYASSVFADSILQTAGDFALLGGTTITSTGVAGTTFTNRNVGVSPGSSITGFPPAIIVDGAIVPAGPVTAQARLATIAFVSLHATPSVAKRKSSGSRSVGSKGTCPRLDQPIGESANTAHTFVGGPQMRRGHDRSFQAQNSKAPASSHTKL